MRIFDSKLENELHLTEEELKKGWLDKGEYIIKKNEEIEENGELITVEREYSENVNIFFPYSDEELKDKGLYEYSEEELKELEYQKKFNELVKKYNDCENYLFATDYKVLKYSEGYYTEEEYKPIKEERESYRVKIRELQEQIKQLNEEYGKQVNIF